MLKFKKISVKFSRVFFSKMSIGGLYFLIFVFTNSCGFHLTKKKSWTTQAESLRLEKIENASKTLGVDFELRKTLELKILKHPELNYTKNLADLNLSIKITQADFSSQIYLNNSGNYYQHLQTLKTKLVLKDLRNLSPAQTEWTLSNQTSLENEEPNLDNYQKTQLQEKNIHELAGKIIDFLTSPNVPRRTK